MAWFALAVMVFLLGSHTRGSETRPQHTQPPRVSKTLPVEVTVPVCVESAPHGITVPVAFRNTSGREVVVVWETPRSIRLWSSQRISVSTGGWASDKKQWIALQAGETARREVVLKFGEDLPALDDGNYTLSLDFAVRHAEADSRHEQLEVIVHTLGTPAGQTLAKVVETANLFYSARPRQKAADTAHWQLTPNMYRQQWLITFGEVGRGPVSGVCVGKTTGKASDPAPIP